MADGNVYADQLSSNFNASGHGASFVIGGILRKSGFFAASHKRREDASMPAPRQTGTPERFLGPDFACNLLAT
jgi:hypothetical protein